MVEENGSVDPLAPSPDPQGPIASSVGVTNSQPHLVAATNIVQLTLPAQTQAQVGVPPLCACSNNIQKFTLTFVIEKTIKNRSFSFTKTNSIRSLLSLF